jgi:hypothetical protein
MRRLKIITRMVQAACLLLACAYSATIPAQESGHRDAVKFDEYGRIGGCDHSARLDNFAIQLQNEPAATGYILIYGPEGEGWGTRQTLFEIINDYLVNSRGIAKDRIQLIHGGRNINLREPKVELWLAPPGAPAPEAQNYETEIQSFKGKFAEQRAWDAAWEDAHMVFDGGTGPPVSDATFASFVDMLKQQKQATGYVVVYNGPDSVPGAWRRVASREVDDLQKRGVESDRVKTIFGGNARSAKTELWIQPRDEPPPVSDAGRESLPAKAVQLGSLTDSSLGHEDTQQSALKELVNVLKLNENLRACLVVRLESLAQEADEDPDAAAAPEESDPGPAESMEESTEAATDEIVEVPPANLPELIQKWRVELASHKIRSDRLVVLFVPTREFEGNTLEAWIVPAGLPLPDPFAEEKVAEETDEPPAPPKPDK